MTELTFEQLPKAISELAEKLDRLERLLLAHTTPTLPESDQFLTIKQVAEMICLTVPTIYGLVHNAEIPVCKRGKRLYFSKQEITEWIKTGRKKTATEIGKEAEKYLMGRKNRF